MSVRLSDEEAIAVWRVIEGDGHLVDHEQLNSAHAKLEKAIERKWENEDETQEG